MEVKVIDIDVIKFGNRFAKFFDGDKGVMLVWFDFVGEEWHYRRFDGQVGSYCDDPQSTDRATAGSHILHLAARCLQSYYAEQNNVKVDDVAFVKPDTDNFDMSIDKTWSFLIFDNLTKQEINDYVNMQRYGEQGYKIFF
jgi:hypothetical protein